MLSISGEQKCDYHVHEANHTRTVSFGGLAISDIVRMIQPKRGLFQHEYELEPD